MATLVAGGALPAEVFSAVADELARLIGAEASFVSRVDHLLEEGRELDESITVVGSYGRVGDEVPVGFRIRLQPGMIQTAALQTGRPARVNGEQLAKGPFGALTGRLGLRAAVATPIGHSAGRAFSVHSPAGGGTTVSCELPVLAGAAKPDAGPASVAAGA